MDAVTGRKARRAPLRSGPFEVERLNKTLLSCPFCGSAAELLRTRPRNHCKSKHCVGIVYWFVRCANQACICYRGTRRYEANMEAPVNLWNRRHHGNQAQS